MAHFHYQNHLNRVSRSFAFCIERLEGDFREWVGLSYLLCRILDTVEDAPWPSRQDREQAFARFEDFLEKGVSLEEVLNGVGLSRKLEWRFTADFRQRYTRQGTQDMIAGFGEK